MPAIHSSLNLCFKPLFLSHSSISFSKFAIPKQVLNPRNLCALASAASHNGGRSGSLSPPPVVEELQRIQGSRQAGNKGQCLVSSLVPQNVGLVVSSTLRRFYLTNDVESRMARLLSSDVDLLLGGCYLLSWAS